jgi:hypothetical protein
MFRDLTGAPDDVPILADRSADMLSALCVHPAQSRSQTGAPIGKDWWMTNPALSAVDGLPIMTEN